MRQGLFKDSRSEIALARARRDRTITLVIAARPHRVGEVGRAVVRLGGIVQQQDAAVDYLRVLAPLDAASVIAALPAVQAADVSVIARWQPVRRAYLGAEPRVQGERIHGLALAVQSLSLTPSTPDTMEWPPRLSHYPFRHPYSPLADVDAAEWRAQHPTWDGRGVTIADLEPTPDLLSPELQTGLTLEGERVAKYVDVQTVLTPGDPADSVSTVWLQMRDRVVSRNRKLIYRGHDYSLPHDGVFRADVVNEHSFSAAFRLDGDLNRDGNPSGADSLFVVLWNERSNMVWVDTDQDGDFRDEQPITDYVLHNEIGVFGHDDPKTPVRETVGFTVQTDRAHHAVALNVGVGAHATMVQGAAAGFRGMRGNYDGVAPGARLVSLSYGAGSAAAIVEAMIQAFKDPRIDVVMLEQNVFVTDLPYVLHDGRSVSSLICTRLIGRYAKPMLVGVGNTAGIGVVGEHAAASLVIGVGAYQSSESYRINEGTLTAATDNLHFLGSGGPAGMGALKPDVLAPSDVLSSWPGYRPGWVVPGLYELPPGYVIASGTSIATPVAAGAVALLISAAKQAGIPYDADRLRRALSSAARHLDRIPTFEQGNGLLQVAAAWNALVRMAEEPGAAASFAIEVRAPVHTALGNWLAVPQKGSGLYEIGTWSAGERGDRRLEFKRMSGTAAPVRLTVNWIGNDGTFTSAGQITLPRYVPVAFPVTVAPATSGAHSAVLELIDPMNGLSVHRISCVVIVPDTFTAPTFSFILRDSVPRPGRKNLFLRVPPGVGGLRFDFSEVTGTVAARLHRPDGRGRRLGAEDIDTTGGAWYVTDPEPGVWQLSLRGDWTTFHIDQQPDTPLPAAKFVLKASLVGAKVTLLPSAGPSAPWGPTVRNVFAPISAALTTAPLASGFATRDLISLHTQRVYTINVPAGTTLLLARVAPVSAPPVDLDLYLFDCTTSQCVPAAESADTGSSGAIAYPHPTTGIWKVVVDAAQMSTDTVTFRYLDLVLNPMYGTTSVADPMRERANGAAWSTRASEWEATTVAAPRQAYSVFTVSDDQVRLADGRMVLPTDRVPLAWTAVALPDKGGSLFQGFRDSLR